VADFKQKDCFALLAMTEFFEFCRVSLGEIRNPGCFSGIHGMNTAQAIAIAGGYTYRACKEKFVPTREGGRKNVADSGTPISAGDTVEVYERYF